MIVSWNVHTSDVVLSVQAPEGAEDPFPTKLGDSAQIAAMTYLFPIVNQLRKDGVNTVLTADRIKDYFTKISCDRNKCIRDFHRFGRAAHCFFHCKTKPADNWSLNSVIEQDLPVLISILRSTKPPKKDQTGYDLCTLLPVSLTKNGMFKNESSIQKRMKMLQKQSYLGDPYVIVVDDKMKPHIRAWSVDFAKEFNKERNATKIWREFVKVARNFSTYSTPVKLC